MGLIEILSIVGGFGAGLAIFASGFVGEQIRIHELGAEIGAAL